MARQLTCTGRRNRFRAAKAKEKDMMTNFKLVAAAALSLLAATPAVAVAAQRVDHHHNAQALRHARNYQSFYGAYGFDRGSNVSADFDRRNTFN
jgi:hypothetical protein